MRDQKICAECGHCFLGNGWDVIDAHWRSEHEDIVLYKEAWPRLRDGTYEPRVPLSDRAIAILKALPGEAATAKGARA